MGVHYQEKYQNLSGTGRNLPGCEYHSIPFHWQRKLIQCASKPWNDFGGMFSFPKLSHGDLSSDMQGTGMEGPIPPSVSLLKELQQLWGTLYLTQSHVPFRQYFAPVQITNTRASFHMFIIISGEFQIWRAQARISPIWRALLKWNTCELIWSST